MHREILLSFIKKYHLDGLCSAVKWVVTKDKIVVKAHTSTSDCIGIITLKNDSYLEPCEFGIFDTSQLISMVSILDEIVNIKIDSNKFLASDNKYNLQYQLADLSLIKSTRKIDQPEYDFDFDIQHDFITQFIEAKGALDKAIARVTFQSDGKGTVKLLFGDKAALSHKIQLTYPVLTPSKLAEIPFSSSTLKTILYANKNFDSANIKISKEGLGRIYINHGEVQCEYFIVRSNDE
jgi:hypothetical protein